MHRVIKVTVSAEGGNDEASRTFTAEGNSLEERLASAHGQLDTAFVDVERATHHRSEDPAVRGEPFTGISIDEQRRRRDEALQNSMMREKSVKAAARGGRGKVPPGNTGAP